MTIANTSTQYRYLNAGVGGLGVDLEIMRNKVLVMKPNMIDQPTFGSVHRDDHDMIRTLSICLLKIEANGSSSPNGGIPCYDD